MKNTQEPILDINKITLDEEESFKLDWPAILQGIFESLWLILFVVALVVVLVVKVVYEWPDRYSSTARIRIDMVQKPTNKYEELLSGDQDRKTFYSTQIEMVQREEILKKTIEDLKLAEFFETTPSEALQILSRHILKVKYVLGTQILAVSATTSDPEIAAKIANSICENYIRLSAIDRLRVSAEVLKLFQEIDVVLKDKQIANSAELRELYGEELEKKIATLPTVMQDPTLIKIRSSILALQQERALFQSRYTNEHPKMKALDGQIETLNNEMQEQKQRVLSALRASIFGDFSAQNAEIVEIAKINTNPSGPERLKYVLFAFFATTGAMLFLVGFLTVFNRRITREDDFKFLNGLPFFGYIPEIPGFRAVTKALKMKRNLVGEFKENTVLADHVYEICTNVVFSMPKDNNKIILLTGVLPEDGKTVASCLVALSMASMGSRVLLVDVDVRAPSVHINFGLENHIGFTDVLIGRAKWQDVVQKPEQVSSLDIITAGGSTRNAPGLLMSEVMSQFIEEVRDKYDKIIIDAPPCLYIPDAFIIGKLTDGIVVVFRSGRVLINNAKKIYARMKHLQLPVIGGCINRANMRKLNGFNNYIDSYQKYYHK